MYQGFKILTAVTNIQDKTITITTNFDIEPDTVNSENIEIYDRSSKNVLKTDLELLNKTIIVRLLEWPIPNNEYILKVQKLLTVLGDELTAGMRKKIIFKSNILSKLNITYPAFNEVIKDLKIAWEEELQSSDHNYENSFYLEIAEEVNFYNIKRSFNVTDRSEIEIKDLPKGQYFVRGRVQKEVINDDNQKELHYSQWSDVITFIVNDQNLGKEDVYDPTDPVDDKEENNTTIEDIETPIFVDSIEILSQPINGQTPKEFVFVFESNIDPNSLKDIFVTRRSI